MTRTQQTRASDFANATSREPRAVLMRLKHMSYRHVFLALSLFVVGCSGSSATPDESSASPAGLVAGTPESDVATPKARHPQSVVATHDHAGLTGQTLQISTHLRDGLPCLYAAASVYESLLVVVPKTVSVDRDTAGEIVLRFSDGTEVGLLEGFVANNAQIVQRFTIETEEISISTPCPLVGSDDALFLSDEPGSIETFDPPLAQFLTGNCSSDSCSPQRIVLYGARYIFLNRWSVRPELIDDAPLATVVGSSVELRAIDGVSGAIAWSKDPANDWHVALVEEADPSVVCPAIEDFDEHPSC